MKTVELGDDSRSLNRPAWTQDDLHAYRHKHLTQRHKGWLSIIKDYYVKTKGET